MAAFKPNPLGILKCRDLVELYFGFPMVATVKESKFALFNTTGQILGQDPRRISYEIVVANVAGAAAASSLWLGSQSSMEQNIAAFYNIPGNETLVVARNFFTDLDEVCAAIFARYSGGTIDIGIREVILTPTPIGEVVPAP